MAVYFVTGKLGSGKSLVAVARIRDYMRQGRRVATNLNIAPDQMLASTSKQTIHRLPDKPRVGDLQAMGDGYQGPYDENKFGLLVLDELGTWFNSRSWQDKERAAVIDWFLHARKRGWDIMFLVQDPDAVDKQLRGALCEYLVICRRLDRIPIPFIGHVMPKVHVAKIIYGENESSGIKAGRWWYKGKELYGAYETRQIFRDDQQLYNGQLVDMRASYTVLSAWHTRGRYIDELRIHWRSVVPYVALVMLVLPALAVCAKARRRSLRAFAHETGIWRTRSLTPTENRARTSLAHYAESPFSGV